MSARHTNESDPLLYTRAQAARLLGVSARTVERLEKDYGLLTPVRITPRATAAVLYRRDELLAVAAGRKNQK